MQLHLGYHPDGFASTANLVCKLIKALYGLKQTSREWLTKLTSCLLEAGYKRSKLDHSLFTFISGSGSHTILWEFLFDLIFENFVTWQIQYQGFRAC